MLSARYSKNGYLNTFGVKNLELVVAISTDLLTYLQALSGFSLGGLEQKALFLPASIDIDKAFRDVPASKLVLKILPLFLGGLGLLRKEARISVIFF